MSDNGEEGRKHFAVTGATGFVGAALVERLQASGAVVSRFGGPRSRGVEGTISLDLGRRFDVRDNLVGCDVLVHCAGLVHNPNGTPDAYETINVSGSVELAEQAKSARVRRFVFVSSIKAMGDSTTGRARLSAKENPAPRSEYGRSKLKAEKHLFSLAVPGEFDVVVVRPPLVYGPGVGANMRSLMRLVSTGFPLPFGVFDNRRSLVSVHNLVHLIELTMTHPRAPGGVFLVSDGEDVSTGELIQDLAASTGKIPRLYRPPSWVMAICQRIPSVREKVDRLFGSLAVDIIETERALDWLPPVGRSASLQATMTAYLTERRA